MNIFYYFLCIFYIFLKFFFLDDELIENMLPEDVWFHVENLSSAHVYLRLKEVLLVTFFLCVQ